MEVDTYTPTQRKINETTLHICITNQPSSYKQFTANCEMCYCKANLRNRPLRKYKKSYQQPCK